MELRTAASFLKVAELESFSRAAEQLGYNQSTVTMQIKGLERELGVTLFDRMGRHVRLTQKGRELVGYCQSLIKLEDEARVAMSSEDTDFGTLGIGCIESMEGSFMRGLLVRYHELHPHVRIEVKTGTSTELAALLKGGAIDFFLTLDHALCRKEWIRHLNVCEDIVLISAPGKTHGVLTPAELAAQPFVLTEGGESYRSALDSQLAVYDLAIDPVIETGDTETIKRLVMDGVGMGFLPRYALDGELASGELVQVESELEPISMWLQLISHKDKTLSGQAREFFNLFQEWENARFIDDPHASAAVPVQR